MEKLELKRVTGRNRVGVEEIMRIEEFELKLVARNNGAVQIYKVLTDTIVCTTFYIVNNFQETCIVFRTRRRHLSNIDSKVEGYLYFGSVEFAYFQPRETYNAFNRDFGFNNIADGISRCHQRR